MCSRAPARRPTPGHGPSASNNLALRPHSSRASLPFSPRADSPRPHHPAPLRGDGRAPDDATTRPVLESLRPRALDPPPLAPPAALAAAARRKPPELVADRSRHVGADRHVLLEANCARPVKAGERVGVDRVQVRAPPGGEVLAVPAGGRDGRGTRMEGVRRGSFSWM